MIEALFFSVMYAIKGGWLGKFLPVDEWSRRSLFVDIALEGAYLSGFLIFLFMLIATATMAGQHATGVPVYELGPVGLALGVALAWVIGVRVSLGEEAGAVGDYKGGWGPYIDQGFGRLYGVKKALQRGIFMGALLTLATGYTPFIVAGASFPLVYFIGNSLGLLVLKERGWSLSEPLLGFVFGVAFHAYLNGGG